VGGMMATPLGIYLFSSKNMFKSSSSTTFLTYSPYFFLAFLVVIFDKLEMMYGEPLASYFGWDYTSFIHSLEGDIVVEIQRWGNNVYLTYILAFMYFVVFTFLLYFSLTFFVFSNEGELTKKVALAYFLNYILVLPFYLFFPVTETWRAYEFLSTPEKIQGLLFNFNTDILVVVTTFSSINNCFPSMHTSLSFTIALISLHSKYRRYTIFCWGSALLIAFSTMYLGIHWVSDVVAGMILALLVYILCRKIEYSISFPFSIDYLRWKKTPLNYNLRYIARKVLLFGNAEKRRFSCIFKGVLK